MTKQNMVLSILVKKKYKTNVIYYFDSPSEQKLICGDCGEKVKTNNEDDDIIFCYKIEQS